MSKGPRAGQSSKHYELVYTCAVAPSWSKSLGRPNQQEEGKRSEKTLHPSAKQSTAGPVPATAMRDPPPAAVVGGSSATATAYALGVDVQALPTLPAARSAALHVETAPPLPADTLPAGAAPSA